MSDNEDIVEPIKKEKKPRTEKQKEAFEKMIAKRKEIDLVKNAHKEAIRKEKEIVRKDRVNKIKEVEYKMSKYKSAEEEEDEEEIVEPVKISKPQSKVKSKPKKKIVVEESSSDDDEPEIVYVKKSKAKKKPKKKKVVVEETSSESSEEEEPKPKKKSGNRSNRYNSPEQELVNQKSEEDIKQELHNQRLKSALRSLGYID